MGNEDGKLGGINYSSQVGSVDLGWDMRCFMFIRHLCMELHSKQCQPGKPRGLNKSDVCSYVLRFNRSDENDKRQL